MPLPPLHEAARNDDVASIKSLIASGVDVDERDFMRRTALHLAACGGRLAASIALIEAGASVDAGDNTCTRSTPLRVAFVQGQKQVASLLIAAGADLEGGQTFYTPARSAFYYNNRSILKLLLRAGAAPPNVAGIPLGHRKAAFALLGSVKAAGGWDDFVLRHRAIIKSIVSKCAPLPDDCLLAIAAFVCPPGGW
jgi:hypothetical protein